MWNWFFCHETRETYGNIRGHKHRKVDCVTHHKVVRPMIWYVLIWWETNYLHDETWQLESLEVMSSR